MSLKRLKKIGRLDLLKGYSEPKNYARWSRSRNLKLEKEKATFKPLDELRTA